MIKRCAWVSGGAITFGVLDALLYNDIDWFWLANTAASYFLLAFIAGAISGPRSIAGAVFGAAATELAVLAFYVLLANQHDLDGYFTMNAYLRYATLGLVSGPLFGLLGAWWSRGRWWAALPVAASLVLEPWAWQVHLGFSPSQAAWSWRVEQLIGVAVGLLAIVVAIRMNRRHRAATSTPQGHPVR